MRASHLLPLTLVLAVCAHAEGPPATTDADRKRGADLVASWTAADPALFGDTSFSVHFNGPANVGHIRMRVDADPEGSGAAYRVHIEGRLELGGGRDQQETLLLDAGLGLVSADSVFGGSAGVTSRRARREGGGWTAKREEAGRAMRGEDATAVTGNYAEDWLLALLARRVPRTPATYELPGLEWIPADGAFTARAVAIVVQVTAPAETTHRGQPVQTYQVRVWQGGRGPIEHTVDHDGRLRELRPAPGVQVVAGTEEQSRQDLPVAPESPDQAAVRQVAGTWFRVLVKVEDPDALDQVLDWAAIQSLVPSAAALEPAAFAAKTKKDLRDAPPPPPGLGATPEAAASKILGMHTFTVTGDDAVGRVGEKLAMRLRRVDGTWRITVLPFPGAGPPR